MNDDDFKKYIEWFTLKVYKDTELNINKITYKFEELKEEYKKINSNFKLDKLLFIDFVKGMYLNEISYSMNNDRFTIYFD